LKVSPFKILIAFIVVSVIGILTIPKLAVKLNPSQGLPSITVQYTWANASPIAVEQNITSILESGFSTVRGIEEIYSRSSKGSGNIRLDLDRKTDIDQVRFEVATIIRQLYKRLPEQAGYPTIGLNRPDETERSSFLGYSISAPFSPFEIQELVQNKIEPIISSIPTIDKVSVNGANPKEYVLSYNNDELRGLGIGKSDLLNALQNNFLDRSLGAIQYGSDQITLSIRSGEADRNWRIPIVEVDGKVLYLNDLVSIREQEQEHQNYYRISGKNSITLSIFAEQQANTIVLAETIQERLDELIQTLPQGYELSKTYDSTEYLKAEINKIYERSFYTVGILLLFVLLVSGSFRYLLITTLGIASNIIIAFLCYYALGVEIQLYSMAGITISLGLVIDNCIVVIDHIRHQGNQRVFVPVLASTLTTIGALGVIFFLEDTYRVNLIDFALVIIINLGVSFLVSFLLVPALLQKIPLPLREGKSWSHSIKERFYSLYSLTVRFLIQWKKLSITVIILAFGLPIFLLPSKLQNEETWYGNAYNTTLGNEWFKEHIRPPLERYTGGAFRLFSIYVFDKAYYGTNEETKLYVGASMEKGGTVHQMNEVFLGLENYLSQFGEIKQFVTRVNSGDNAQLEVTFKEKDALSNFPYVLKSRITRKAIDFGGVEWNIYGVGKGYSNSNLANEQLNYSLKATGYNYDELNRWTDTLKVALEEHPRVHNVTVRENSFRPLKRSYEYRFEIDKERLALAQVPPAGLIGELRDQTLSRFQETALKIQGKYTSIRFQSKQSVNFDIWAIKNSPLDSLQSPFLLKEVATVTKEREDENIHKRDQEYIRRVDFQYTGSYKGGQKHLKKTLDKVRPQLPLGYRFEPQQAYRSFRFGEEEKSYASLLLLVLGIIYFICAILFESFKQPFIILSVIPISFIGVFLTFYIFDFNFDQGGLSSFVLLSGITVNASIFILNGFNRLKKEFPESNSLELYMQAFRQKIFPILLTVLSTILGFIPFIKDGQNEVFWFALGVGTIGGLIFSLVGILFYLPVFSLKKKTVFAI